MPARGMQNVGRNRAHLVASTLAALRGWRPGFHLQHAGRERDRRATLGVGFPGAGRGHPPPISRLHPGAAAAAGPAPAPAPSPTAPPPKTTTSNQTTRPPPPTTTTQPRPSSSHHTTTATTTTTTTTIAGALHAHLLRPAPLRDQQPHQSRSSEQQNSRRVAKEA